MRIGVIGAGAVGGYIAIALSAAGADVRMLYKKGKIEGDSARVAIARDGRRHERSTRSVLTDDPACLDGVDLCLVCVKSYDTDAAMRVLLERRVDWLLSLQNGIFNAARLREQLGSRVLAGAVTFNVTRAPDGVRRQGTRGAVLVEDRREARPTLARLQAALGSVGESFALRSDIERVQAGKLLLNLNNGVCAATGLSVLEFLSSRDARWCFARCLVEGEKILRACDLAPAQVAPLSARSVARTMRLPGPLLALGARLSGAVTPAARTSTLQDLERGRPTEIGALNGAIVELGRGVGQATPANEAVTSAVLEHERALARGERIAFLAPGELRARVEEPSAACGLQKKRRRV